MIKVEILLLSELQLKHHMTTAGGWVGGGGTERAEKEGLLSEQGRELYRDRGREQIGHSEHCKQCCNGSVQVWSTYLILKLLYQNGLSKPIVTVATTLKWHWWAAQRSASKKLH